MPQPQAGALARGLARLAGRRAGTAAAAERASCSAIGSRQLSSGGVLGCSGSTSSAPHSLPTNHPRRQLGASADLHSSLLPSAARSLAVAAAASSAGHSSTAERPPAAAEPGGEAPAAAPTARTRRSSRRARTSEAAAPSLAPASAAAAAPRPRSRQQRASSEAGAGSGNGTAAAAAAQPAADALHAAAGAGRAGSSDGSAAEVDDAPAEQAADAGGADAVRGLMQSSMAGFRTNTRVAARQKLQQEQAQAQQLLEQLAAYCEAYYAGRPLVSDDVYDSELDRFEALLDSMRASVQPSGASMARQLQERSPLRQVGAVPVSSLSKVSHPTPMTSLAAVKDRKAVLAWGERLGKATGAALDPGAAEWVIEPKIDGLAMRLVYRNGRLVLAATRGDGSTGEEVTHNCVGAGAVSGLPLRLAASELAAARAAAPAAADAGSEAPKLPRELEVRGEVFITTDDFARVNSRQQAAGQPAFANARNAAAGSIRLLDPNEARQRRLSFMAYQLLLPREGDKLPDSLPATQSGRLAWLRALGFRTTTDVTAATLGQATYQGFQAAVEAAGEWMTQRESVGFDVDGAVLKLDDLRLQRQLGVDAAQDPRWAVAWKFPAKAATTIIRDVQWSVGRSGALTPVAVMEPVRIGGVEIRHASLHNVGQLRRLGLAPGDVVMVQRAGDVIPQVTGRLKAQRQPHVAPFPEPSVCPSCRGPLRFVEPVTRGAQGSLQCDNPLCPAQQLERQRHFLDVCVKGLGPARAQQLWERGWLNSPAGLYQLTKADLLTLPGSGDKAADKMLAAIEASKAMSLGTLLQGLGIEHVGKAQAQNLAAKYKTIKALQLAANDSSTHAATGDGGGDGDGSTDGSSADGSSADGSSSADSAHGAGGSTEPAASAAPEAGGSTRSRRRSRTSASPAGVGAAAAAGGAATSSRQPREPEIPGLLGQSLAAWFADSANKLLLNELRNAGLHCCRDDPVAADAVPGLTQFESGTELPGGIPGVTGPGWGDVRPLEGVSVAMTGTFTAAVFARRTFAQVYIAERLGGTFRDRLTKTTDWLLVGENPGTRKVRDAERWGIRMLSEDEFRAELERLQLLKQGYRLD